MILITTAIIGGTTYNINSGSSEGTVTDNTTGLTWTRCGLTTNGDENLSNDCTGQQLFLWDDAINACESLNFAGIDNWRLPNIRELNSITTNYKNSYPQINSSAFPGSDGEYWSSSTHINDSRLAWHIYATMGMIRYGRKITITGDPILLHNGDPKTCFVRCVAGP